MMEELQILLTNDDGIESPGLWAAAEALDELGYVTVIAPREQSSGAGRSFSNVSDGQVREQTLEVNGKHWTVHAIGGTPAMAVLYGVMRLLPQKPDLVVSGINYGLNVGSGVTISGTVGAALEAAALEIPALAISLETEKEFHTSYSREIDFSTAGFFTKYFSNILKAKKMPQDVQVLKVEVPAQATPETPWQVTKLSMVRFYKPITTDLKADSGSQEIGYEIVSDRDNFPPGTDTHAVVNQGEISVTPLSLDLTSRTNIQDLEKLLRED